MDKFHDPIIPAEHIHISRKSRYKAVTKACYKGIMIRSIIIAAQLLGYIFTHSQALYLDSISTSLDICFSIFLVLSIKYASRPPDENHPFGHGRFEPIAGLQLGVILIALGAILGVQQFKNTLELKEQIFPFYTFIIPLCAALLMEACYRYFKYVAGKSHSSALLSDAYTFRTDAISSVIATAALGTGLLLPNYAALFDHLGALSIATMMIISGLKSSHENLHQLLDKKPSRSYLSKIEEAALRIKGVLATEKLRVQRYGPDAHVDIDIEVDPKSTVMHAHRIAQQVRASIQEDMPEVQDVMVHVEPYFEADH
jgi:cation diffusion facilitator family transporter